MGNLASIFRDDALEHWKAAREEARRLPEDILKERVRHYEDLQDYLGIFRVSIHLAEALFGKAVTYIEYQAARDALEWKKISYYGKLENCAV